MVHIVSILNLTRYETQVNRQWINIILKELTKCNEDIRALFNITNQLATQVQVQNIVLHLRAMLENLRDCLHFMKQLANRVLEYIDTATTGTLTPHLIPVPDLQKMLYQVESELPPNMHLLIPSSDPLHLYRYLRTHVLVEKNQFLLLIDVPIQDRAQQIQIYKIINLPVPVLHRTSVRIIQRSSERHNKRITILFGLQKRWKSTTPPTTPTTHQILR